MMLYVKHTGNCRRCGAAVIASNGARGAAAPSQAGRVRRHSTDATSSSRGSARALVAARDRRQLAAARNCSPLAAIMVTCRRLPVLCVCQLLHLKGWPLKPVRWRGLPLKALHRRPHAGALACCRGASGRVAPQTGCLRPRNAPAVAMMVIGLLNWVQGCALAPLSRSRGMHLWQLEVDACAQF